ncbi:MAG: hypothetical protein ACR2J8_11560 [Thermomicrobiales bacterium]
MMLWRRGGLAVILRASGRDLIEQTRWATGGAIAGAAVAPDGRLFYAKPGPPNGADLPTALVRVYRPDPASPTGYTATADLGPLIGAPGALSLDSFGNLAALTSLSGDGGIPQTLFNLFDATPDDPSGFTLWLAMWPFGQATTVCGGADGSLLLLAAQRAIVALVGDIHNPNNPVTVWDGRNAGRGPWIEAAAIATGPGGELHVLDGCTGILQVAQVDTSTGRFSAMASGATRELPDGQITQPAGLAIDRNGAALILNRTPNGGRSVLQFRREAGAGAAVASRSQATRALDPGAWRPVPDATT